MIGPGSPTHFTSAIPTEPEQRMDHHASCITSHSSPTEGPTSDPGFGTKVSSSAIQLQAQSWSADVGRTPAIYNGERVASNMPVPLQPQRPRQSIV